MKSVLRCVMERTVVTTGEVIEDEAAFHSGVEMNLEGDSSQEIWEKMIEVCLENMAEFQRMGSNWRFQRVVNFELHFVEFQPLGTGTWIKLPAKIAAKKAVVNPQNFNDEKCFRWAILIALDPAEKHPERITEKVVSNCHRLNWEGIEFPMILQNISRFEKNNPEIFANAFVFQQGVYPLRISKTKGRVVDLLLISDGEKQHFCWITNLSRLLSSQIDSHEHQVFFCRRCLYHFPSEKKLDEHMELCSRKDFVKVEMEGGTLSFKNWKKKRLVWKTMSWIPAGITYRPDFPGTLF